MRKQDVFGKKITRVNVIFWLIISFLIIYAGHVVTLRIQNNRINALEQERIQIQAQINELLSQEEAETVHAIADIIQFLPNTFNQNQTAIELELIRNLSGLANASGYRMTFNKDVSSPFQTPLASSVKYVSISISLNTTDAASILVFINNILTQDTLYYIANLNISYQSDGGATMNLTLYTFYNDVDL